MKIYTHLLKKISQALLISNRDTYCETGDPAQLSAQLAGDGDKLIKTVYGEGKKLFYTRPTRAAKTEQNSLVPARQA